MSDLEDVLSRERLARYPGRSLDERIELYRWNALLCEGLYPTLHYLEVALRNRMHVAFTGYFSSEWWFEDPAVVTHPYPRGEVRKARRGVKGRDVVAGDIVAGVSFGFWRGFFLKEYEGWWRDVVFDVFPEVPLQWAKRKLLNPRVEAVRRLRNRVFHHEPVFYLSDLGTQHGNMHEMVSWLSSSALRELQRVDRFPTVFANGPRGQGPRNHEASG